MKRTGNRTGDAAGPGEVLLDLGADKTQAQGKFPFAADESMDTRKIMPLRYQVREDDSGRFLTCTDAPNLAVRIERGFSVSGSSARKYPEHSLFLDGAAQGEPFIDSSRHVHSLDHHEGCVRSFTLATCEQAMVMVLKGLDLDGQKWTVYANEPDLDTVLAVWVLLNHRRLTTENSAVRRRIMPLVRLEGVIDAHGFELADLTGFSVGLQKKTHQLIDRLRSREAREREEGTWTDNDPLEYSLGVLGTIDGEMYEPADFSHDVVIEELERVPLVGDRFAVACRAETGIYEVEQQLRSLHGDRVGLILLERTPGAWTLRQVDPFLPHGLVALYDRLNLLDPLVKGDNRWGGSAEIGGSPRGTASGLSQHEITAVCRWVFRPPTGLQKVRSAVSGAALAIAVVAAAVLVVLPTLVPLRAPAMMTVAEATTGFSSVLFLLSAGVLIFLAKRVGSVLLGIRMPVGGQWPTLALVIFAAAAAGGGWGAIGAADGIVSAVVVGWSYAALLALGAAAGELLLRGAVHGLLAETFPIMIPHGRWFASIPLVLTSALSAGFTIVFFLPTILVPTDLASPIATWGLWVVAAIIMGFASGLVRERSASVWPAAALHATAVVAAWVGFNLVG